MLREARPDEWEALRSLRLRALAESPAAFARSVEEEQALPEAEWQARAAMHPDRVVLVLEETSGDLAGSIVGFDEGDAVRVGGMWVAPARRGEGHGRALLEAVLAWAQARGAKLARLGVNPHQVAAVALYESAGFSRSGCESAPTATGAPCIELELKLDGVRLRPVEQLAPLARSIVDAFAASLAAGLPNAEIHHIGATALPTGVTKGDVDVNVRVPREEFEAAVAALRERYAVAQPENWTQTFASFRAPGFALPLGVQLTARGAPDDFLLELRDRMRADPSLLRRYDEVKRVAAPRGADAYWDAKDAFLRGVLGRPAT